MNSVGLQKIIESPDLTEGEKLYIKDCQYRMGGSFSRALWTLIGLADEHNLARLCLVFPNEVQGFIAWTRGDLHERASLIAGGDCGFIAEDK